MDRLQYTRDEMIQVDSLIHEYSRHLKLLEMQKAKQGAFPDTRVLIAIEDTRKEIEGLHKKRAVLQQLGTLAGCLLLLEDEATEINNADNTWCENLPKDQNGKPIHNYSALPSMGLLHLVNEAAKIEIDMNKVVDYRTRKRMECFRYAIQKSLISLPL